VPNRKCDTKKVCSEGFAPTTLFAREQNARREAFHPYTDYAIEAIGDGRAEPGDLQQTSLPQPGRNPPSSRSRPGDAIE
jgi:hypothetical protein